MNYLKISTFFNESIDSLSDKHLYLEYTDKIHSLNDNPFDTQKKLIMLTLLIVIEAIIISYSYFDYKKNNTVMTNSFLKSNFAFLIIYFIFICIKFIEINPITYTSIFNEKNNTGSFIYLLLILAIMVIICINNKHISNINKIIGVPIILAVSTFQLRILTLEYGYKGIIPWHDANKGYVPGPESYFYVNLNTPLDYVMAYQKLTILIFLISFLVITLIEKQPKIALLRKQRKKYNNPIKTKGAIKC